jgi:putative membrane protein
MTTLVRRPTTNRARLRRAAAAAWLILAAFSPRLAAHGNAAPASPSWWQTWEFDPAVILPLYLLAASYYAGLRNLRTATGERRKLRREAWCFAAAWSVLVVALISPMHPLSRSWFSLHMTQHELLMVVAAPLLVMGRPGLVLLWFLPRAHARQWSGKWRRAGGARAWRWFTRPFVATLVHAVALWVWHVPVWFEATLTSDLVHAVQHLSFFGTAVLFWQAMLQGERRAADYGLAVAYLFLTAMHSGALGALLTFATQLWYPSYAAATQGRMFTALEDQQLGGLIMWIPAGTIYVVAGLVLFAGWLTESDRRASRKGAVKGSGKCAPVS